jgi:hypothetical protein
MRVLVAGIMGGVVLFFWGFVAHMLLGLGNPGIHQPAHEDVVLNVLHDGLGMQPGVYILPSIEPAQMSDPAAVAAYGKKAAASPYAWMVYEPQGTDMSHMRPQLTREWASDTLSALALACLMGLAAFSFTRRLGIAVVATLFAWLSVMIPYWNWYRFPTPLALAELVEQLIGWLLAGAAMAWWLGRGENRTA